MSESTNQNTGNTPSHIAYHVRDREGGKGFWIRIGSAWTHNDRKGFSIQVDTVPLDGRITLRASDDSRSGERR